MKEETKQVINTLERIKKSYKKEYDDLTKARKKLEESTSSKILEELKGKLFVYGGKGLSNDKKDIYLGLVNSVEIISADSLEYVIRISGKFVECVYAEDAWWEKWKAGEVKKYEKPVLIPIIQFKNRDYFAFFANDEIFPNIIEISEFNEVEVNNTIDKFLSTNTFYKITSKGGRRVFYQPLDPNKFCPTFDKDKIITTMNVEELHKEILTFLNN